jgi:hypothetical protein
MQPLIASGLISRIIIIIVGRFSEAENLGCGNKKREEKKNGEGFSINLYVLRSIHHSMQVTNHSVNDSLAQ